MSKVVVTIDIEKFITDVEDTGEVGCLDLFVSSLVNSSEEALQIIVDTFPSAIKFIENPSKQLIERALLKDPTLVLQYQPEFKEFSKDTQHRIYLSLARARSGVLREMRDVPDEYIRRLESEEITATIMSFGELVGGWR